LLQAKRFGIHATQLGMISATPLGDVMEESGEIDDLVRGSDCMIREAAGNSWSYRGIANRRKLLTTNSV